MKREDVAAALAAERLALADLFAGLSPEQLKTPSLCAGWTVKHVAAHITTLFNVSMPQMTVRIARNRFDFDKAVRQLTEELARQPIDEIVATLRANADNTRHPPTAPLAPLTDVIVHGEDVRRPLGVTRDVPFASVSAAMTFVTSGRASGFVPAKRVRGLLFQATDHDGNWGKGQLIHGPAMSLLLGAMGRRVALRDLGGAVNVLDTRLTGTVPRIQ